MCPKKCDFDISKGFGDPISEDFIKSLDVVEIVQENSDIDVFKSLLFLFGYLTIKEANEDNSFYYLDFPNKEVKTAFKFIHF